jgi:trans-aconitate methyltransferase
MSSDNQTIQTYDNSADQIAAHFKQYKDGVAREEIDLSFKLARSPAAARVIEIGCGAGKEATEIIKRAGWYEGFDPSEKLLAIARSQNPGASFVNADALSYSYPNNIDIVFALASMLHLNKEDFAATCEHIVHCLRPGGVLCMTLKEADDYTEQLQEDTFGTRLFYLYTPSLVRELAGPSFKQVHESHRTAGPEQKRWMSLILAKR